MRGYRRLVVHRRILINLTDGSAIDGILWDESGPLIVVRDGHLHAPGGSDPTPLDGEVIIDRERIAFVQAVL